MNPLFIFIPILAIGFIGLYYNHKHPERGLSNKQLADLLIASNSTTLDREKYEKEYLSRDKNQQYLIRQCLTERNIKLKTYLFNLSNPKNEKCHK